MRCLGLGLATEGLAAELPPPPPPPPPPLLLPGVDGSWPEAPHIRSAVARAGANWCFSWPPSY